MNPNDEPRWPWARLAVESAGFRICEAQIAAWEQKLQGSESVEEIRRLTAVAQRLGVGLRELLKNQSRSAPTC